jgi:hypothetical protein
MQLEKYKDPNDEFNSPKYHTGKDCIEPGCSKPAGTWWSPLWCFECNVKRIDRISGQFEMILGATTQGDQHVQQ